MSKSRDNKHRRQRATRKLAQWRKRRSSPRVSVVPVEIVAVEGSVPGLPSTGS